jgi:hypothetical protein
MSEGTPSQTGVDGGRDAAGRFAKGNRASKGNVAARKAAQCRAKLFSVVTMKDFTEIVKQTVALAKAGQPWAVKLLLEYLLGQPVQWDLLERIEKLETLDRGGYDR